MIKIHPDIVSTVKREISKEWLAEMCAKVKETDPVMFEFWKSTQDKIGTIGLGFVILLYRVIESQLEVDELNDQ